MLYNKKYINLKDFETVELKIKNNLFLMTLLNKLRSGVDS